MSNETVQENPSHCQRIYLRYIITRQVVQTFKISGQLVFVIFALVQQFNPEQKQNTILGATKCSTWIIQYDDQRYDLTTIPSEIRNE